MVFVFRSFFIVALLFLKTNFFKKKIDKRIKLLKRKLATQPKATLFQCGFMCLALVPSMLVFHNENKNCLAVFGAVRRTKIFGKVERGSRVATTGEQTSLYVCILHA